MLSECMICSVPILVFLIKYYQEMFHNEFPDYTLRKLQLSINYYAVRKGFIREINILFEVN